MDIGEISKTVLGSFQIKDTTVKVWFGQGSFSYLEGVVCPIKNLSKIDMAIEPVGLPSSLKLVRIYPDERFGRKFRIYVKTAFREEDIKDVIGEILQVSKNLKMHSLAIPMELFYQIQLPLRERFERVLDAIFPILLRGKAPKHIVFSTVMTNEHPVMNQQGDYLRKRFLKDRNPRPDRDGQVFWIPDRDIVTGEIGTWQLIYKVGRRLNAGQCVTLFIGHPSDWGSPQTMDSKGLNYCSVINDGKATVGLVFQNHCGRLGWLLSAFVYEGELKRGDKITFTLGDKRFGSPGMRAQTVPQKGQYLRVMGDIEEKEVLADAYGKERPAHPQSPHFNVVTGPAKKLVVNIPSHIKPGEKFDAVIRVDDEQGNPCLGFEGEFLINPAIYAESKRVSVRKGSKGRVTINNLKVSQKGIYRIKIEDTKKNLEALSNPTYCNFRQLQWNLYWGDIHIHSNLSDGNTDPDECYQYAQKSAGLQIAALADHDFFYNAVKTKKATPQEAFEIIKKLSKKYYQPGRFVTLPGYEFSGDITQGGHRNVYYSDESEAELFPSAKMVLEPEYHHEVVVLDAGKLNRLLKRKKAMVIPHCIADRGIVWKFHDPGLCPVAEIYSCHGNSESYPNTRPLHTSWIEYNRLGEFNSYSGFLKKGLKLGAIGGTDGHDGTPGVGMSWLDYRGGIMGVYMKELNREALWDAIFSRRVYATTGEKILLEFRVNDLFIGEEGIINGFPVIHVKVSGTAPVDVIEILRNEVIVYVYHGGKWDEDLEWTDIHYDGKPSWYRVRITQHDGEMAWSSPIWVSKKY